MLGAVVLRRLLLLLLLLTVLRQVAEVRLRGLSAEERRLGRRQVAVLPLVLLLQHDRARNTSQ